MCPSNCYLSQSLFMLSSVTCWLYAFSFIGNIVVTPLKAHSEYRREEDYLGDTMMTADDCWCDHAALFNVHANDDSLNLSIAATLSINWDDVRRIHCSDSHRPGESFNCGAALSALVCVLCSLPTLSGARLRKIVIYRTVVWCFL